MKLIPGSAPPLEPRNPQPSPGTLDPPNPLAGLNLRLSASAVVEGTITYPRELVDDEGRRLGTTGRLIVARAALTPGMPYELLAYAQADQEFPHDGTSDQWFDDRRFDAYQTLGRAIGKQAETLLVRHTNS